jgi:hypothetical protein
MPAASSVTTLRPSGLAASVIRHGRGRDLPCLERLVEGAGHAGLAHRAGLDDVDRDAEGADLLGEVAGELGQRGLGGAQRDHAFARASAQPGAEVDDPAAALPGHAGQHGLRDRERRAHLLVELAAELVPGHLAERLDDVRGERVVHEHVDLAPRLADLLDHLLDRGRVAHVGLHGHRPPARGLDLAHDLLGCRGAVQVVDHHTHAPPGQQARGGRADSAAGARHQRHPVRRLSHESTSCSSSEPLPVRRIAP